MENIQMVLLPIILLALGKKVLNIPKMMLFFLNSRKEPNLFEKLRDDRSIQLPI